MADREHRVLVVFPGALGDLICLGPSLRAISRRHPDASIDLAARGELARLAVGRFGISRGYSIDRREFSDLFRSGSEGIRVETRAFFGAFDRIYSFFATDDRNFRSRLAIACEGGVSFHPFLPHSTSHVASAYLESIGAGSEPLDFLIEPSPDDLAAASGLLEKAGLSPREFVSIFPGSGSALKNWPLDGYVCLAEALPYPTVFILGPAESGFVVGSGKTMTGLPLAIVAAIARIALAFVGNDSGVSHLAAAVGTPGVVLFGPTDPARWAPRGRISVLRRDPISAIDPKEVAATLGRILETVKN